MSNYIEFNDRMAFHPGYYIKEIVDDSGLTQADFARRLGTTPKNLSDLINGYQSLSIDIANKLSRLLGTSVVYWLNIQNAYDEMLAEIMSYEELQREKDIFRLIDYNYFVEYCGLPELKRNVDEQIRAVRDYLCVSSLCTLENRDLAVSFRSFSDDLSKSNIVNSNIMIQIAVNKALKTNSPKYNRKRFEEAARSILSLNKEPEGFLSKIRDEFREAGVIFVVLPNIKNSGINGVTKKISNRRLILVNNRRRYADTFWFTLFHEISHVLNDELGPSTDGNEEDVADEFAQDLLIPRSDYQLFLSRDSFDEKSIRSFADSVGRDPGIVLGRLLTDKKVSYNSTLNKRLRHYLDILPECYKE